MRALGTGEVETSGRFNPLPTAPAGERERHLLEATGHPHMPHPTYTARPHIAELTLNAVTFSCDSTASQFQGFCCDP